MSVGFLELPKSASGGEAQIAFKAMELEEAGFSFEEVVKRLEEFRDKLKTYFVLDNLETLRKNGRLTGVKAFVATTMNIKPLMIGDDGMIAQRGQAIGIKKALARLADMVVAEAENPEERSLIITHCNCLARAESIKQMVLDKIKVKKVLIMDTAGISSMYANDGGVIVTL